MYPTAPQPGWPPQPPPNTPVRPRWARKRIVLPALLLTLFIGAAIGGAGDSGDAGGTQVKAAADTSAQPTATVTATATETRTATATPEAQEPAPTVTVTATRTAKVRVTVTARAPSGGGGTSGGGTSDNGTSGGGDSDTYYANCTAVRAAGAAPIHVGDPGYGAHLDRDGDGVACE